MKSIASITIETAERAENDVDARADAEAFYSEVLGLGDRVFARQGKHPAVDGFSGFVLGLVFAEPAAVDAVMTCAAAAGAEIIRPAKKSLWGYGGVLYAPDRAVVTVASASKRDTGAGTDELQSLVLQLAVADVATSKQFYVEQGLTVAKSFGRRYVEFDTGAITLTLNPLASLAKTVGVSPEGPGACRLVVHGEVLDNEGADGDEGSFTDPDGSVWEHA